MAVLAAGLALLASVAIVTLVPGPWYRLCAQKSFPDPVVAGHVRVGLACVRVYSFHIAAGAGALLASLIALPSPKVPSWPRLLIFVVLCDVFAMWIGGAIVFWTWRDPTMPSALHGIGLWLQWPFSALLMGLMFGNFTTKGFGLAIALPTLAWLFFAQNTKRSWTEIRGKRRVDALDPNPSFSA